MFTVAIAGRPNVGKSTLFNRLIGQRHALVDDRPGVTRDRREATAYIAGVPIKVIDTAGLEEAAKDSLERRMVEQSTLAVDEAHLCLFVIDGAAGLNHADRHYADWLRMKDKPVILLVNKCEGSRGDDGYMEALTLGFDDVIMISAEHNEGMGELYDVLLARQDIYEKAEGHLSVEAQKALDDEGNEIPQLQLAILGRPNAGKSTYLNCLLGEDRMLVGPEAGITRDAIATDWQYKGQPIKLIDTAGIRRRSHVREKLEKLSVSDALRALNFAHVAVLMMDANIALEKQDLAIADVIIKEGRPLVIALNKWDEVKDKDAVLDEVQYQVNKILQQIRGVPIITISALKGVNTDNVIDAALELYKTWNVRLPTAKINQWLKDAESKHLPPLGKNKRRIRLKYITQGNTRPPTFTLFANRPEDIPKSYRRYLVNDLRSVFGLDGVPIRMMFRKSDNPYG